VLNEQEIITGCKKYRQTAQKALYDKYASLMRGVCMRYVRDESEVKDLLQEGFLKVFKNINSYKGSGSFEGWIKRVMINNAINHYQKNRKLNQHIEIGKINEIEIQDEVPEDSEIDDSVDRLELNSELVQKAGFSHDELLEIMNQIEEPFRLVFNLHYIENYRHDEIAGLLNIEIATSRTRLLRARKLIKQKLYEACINKLGKLK
jgi:RNA polymerase sigma-70 factor (ECF subfamily)